MQNEWERDYERRSQTQGRVRAEINKVKRETEGGDGRKTLNNTCFSATSSTSFLGAFSVNLCLRSLSEFLTSLRVGVLCITFNCHLTSCTKSIQPVESTLGNLKITCSFSLLSRVREALTH